jgi:ribosomal protein L35AE/L33A
MTAQEFAEFYAGRKVRFREGSYSDRKLWGKIGRVQGASAGMVIVRLDENMLGSSLEDLRYFTPDVYEPLIEVLPLPG